MGMAIDDARRQGESVGLHGLAGGTKIRADGGNPAVLHAEVAVDRPGARTVVDFRILDDQIEHVFFLPEEP